VAVPTGALLPGNAMEGLSPPQLRTNFLWVAVCFSVNHGVVTAPLVVTTPLLGKDVGNIGNGVLYTFTLLSALLIAAPITTMVGPKKSMVFAMLLYCVYVTCFAVAVLVQAQPKLVWIIFLFGNVCGGLAAGVLWTAQGGYFASTATLIAEDAAAGESREAVTGSLSGLFAAIYLVGEVGSKLGFTLLQKVHVTAWQIGFIYAGLGAAALAGMTMALDLRASTPVATARPLAKVVAVVSLWHDPLIWLLSPTNLTFGFSAAFMNSYVNANYAKMELGEELVTFLAAITALSAALLAPVYGAVSRVAGKGPTITAGAICFSLIPCCILVLGCCNGWGWFLILLYLLQGSGRSVYESTNRAMFSDFFTGPATDGAFGNCMLQSSLSFAICFFLQTALTGHSLAFIVLALAILTPFSYLLAVHVKEQRRWKQEALSLLQDGQVTERNYGA